MTETITKYQTTDKNEEKIKKMTSALVARLNDWLEGKPTGQRKLTIDISANQGGVTDSFIEELGRERV